MGARTDRRIPGASTGSGGQEWQEEANHGGYADRQVGGILLGIALGGLASLLCAWVAVATRPHRRARSIVAIRVVQVSCIGSFLGSFLLLAWASDRMGIGRPSRQFYMETYAWIASLVVVEALVIRSEIRWRKSVGLDDKTLLSKHERKD